MAVGGKGLNWEGTGLWEGWRITTHHPLCKDGQALLVDPNGTTYSPNDIYLSKRRLTHVELAREMNITKQALTGRRQRKTVPDPDGQDESGKPWWYENTVSHLFKPKSK